MTLLVVVEVLGLAGCLLLGCAKSPVASGDSGALQGKGLTGTAWRLQDLGGAVVLDGVEATLEFPEEGKVAGRGSCNRFFGSVKVEGEKISFGPLGSTKMACPEAISNQESKYLEALQSAERFTVDGSTLSIHSPGTKEPLRFERVVP
jgi:heat shock protein HslJ